MKISRNLLNELVNVWVERRGGFRLSKEIFRFSLLDVCLGLGLRVVGSKIDLNEGLLDSISPISSKNCVLISLQVMSAYFCPHLMFNSGYLIEFVCLKIDLIGISYNWVY